MQVNEPLNKPLSYSYTTVFNIGAILLITLAQLGWLAFIMGSKLALVNLLPAAVFISVWTLFITHYYAHKPLVWFLLLMPVLILNLRLPVTVFHDLQVVNWLMYLIMAVTVGRHMMGLFSSRKEKLFLVFTVVLLAASAMTHLGLDSPYTYTFRMMNGLPSAYAGVDNNATWECAYERPQFPVHCDARHFIASEKIFTEPGFNPSYSVVLTRFLHGYLNSLAGLDGTRWWVNLSLNCLFWFFACVCVYRISTLLKQSNLVAGLSMLCCASGIGFIDMLAQPLPYLLAYAYGSIAIWATMELIYSELDKWRIALFIILIASVVMVYDAYPLILACALLLFLDKKKQAAVCILLLSVIFTVMWRVFSMKMVLGTQGNSSHGNTGALLMLDVLKWLDVVKTANVMEFFRLSLIGSLAYLYGNLIIGVVAAWAYIFGVARPATSSHEQKTLLNALIILNILVLLATLFAVPQMTDLSPTTSMQPRLAFYSYPINMIALTLISVAWLKKYAWITPLILFIVVNINLSGLTSIDMLFDYGRVGIYWK